MVTLLTTMLTKVAQVYKDSTGSGFDNILKVNATSWDPTTYTQLNPE